MRLFRWCGILATAFVSSAATMEASAAEPASSAVVDETRSAPYSEALQDRFGVSATEISGFERSGFPLEELPILFMAASQAQIAPAQVLAIRLRGKRWQSVIESLGLGVSIFYVPIDDGEPLAEPFRSLGNGGPAEWDRVFLSDRNVVELANLRFVVDVFDGSPRSVLEMRAAGVDFLDVVIRLEDQRQQEERLRAANQERNRHDDQYSELLREQQRAREKIYEDWQEQMRRSQELYEDWRDQMRLAQEAYEKRQEQSREDQKAYEKRQEQLRLERETYEKQQEQRRREQDAYEKRQEQLRLERETYEKQQEQRRREQEAYEKRQEQLRREREAYERQQEQRRREQEARKP